MKNYLLLSDKEILLDISNKLKKYRLSKNISQEEISKKTGISIHSISNIENGKSFTIENLIKYMIALDISYKLENLIPNIEYNPYELINEKNEKKRVKKKNINTWSWGENWWKALK